MALPVTRAAAQQGATAGSSPTGLPEDWTHHHVMFSNPGSYGDALKNGSLENWARVMNNPRYVMQRSKRSAAATSSSTSNNAAVEETAAFANAIGIVRSERATKPKPLKKDWSMDLGGSAASLTGLVGTLSSSTVSGSSTLTVDGVTLDASAPTAAAGSVQVNCTTSTCGTYTVTIGSTTYSIVSSLSGTQPSNAVLDGGSGSGHLTTATNLRAAMLDDSSQCSGTCFKNVSAANANVTSGSAANPLTLTAKTVGTGGNSIVLSDTGCTSSQGSGGCANNGITEMTLNTTSTTSTITSSTLGATSSGQTGTPGSDGTTSGTSSPPTFAYWSSSTYLTAAQVATNIVTAINANTTLQTVSTGVSATANTPSSGNVTVTARTGGASGNSRTVATTGFSAFTGTGSLSGGSTATVGAGQYPAKYSFSTTSASCTDFVVHNTGLAGSGTQASIIAYTNIYTGCTGTVPQVAWEYNTGGTITTSPVLSLDGTQIAFIHNPGSSSSANLVLLRFSSSGSTVTSPTVATSASNYHTGTSCAAPCMYSMTLTKVSPDPDTYSAPFYDYSTDTLYVGDDAGYLHQFTGVFKGTPSESGAPWPVLTNAAGNKLGSPVYDGNGNVFVADYAGSSSGHVYRVTTAGTLTASAQLGAASLPFVDAPVVDSTAGKVYLFESKDASSSAGVFQLPTTLSTATEATIGTASTSVTAFAGAFDNAYFTSTATSPTGNLYVCGNPGGIPTLYGITITANAITGGAATSKATPGNTAATCSPVTEFFNGNDYLFLSVTNETTSPPTGCTSGSGCIFSYNDSGFAFKSLPEAGGTSGIVIDNNVTSGTLTASQVYFSTLGTQTCTTSTGSGGCAIQASQAALQ